MLTTFTPEQLRQQLCVYSSQAATSDGRRTIAANIEATIRRSKIAGALLDKVRLMYAYVRDPHESVKPKLLIGAALLYLVTPADFIPDWFGLVGFVDDAAAIMYVWNRTADVLLNYEKRRAGRSTSVTDAV